MISTRTSAGGLPPGEHAATWDDIVVAYGQTAWRRYLIDGFARACAALSAAGCTRVWLDGSFTTAKDPPGDFDGCWDAVGVDPLLLDPVLLDFSDGRAAQKAKYGGELFPSSWSADATGRTFIEFFQTDKDTGTAKGILVLDPRSAP